MSLEVSDDAFSSEDEDIIIAKMQPNTGLPQKGHVSGQGSTNMMKTMQTDTAVATVTMSGVVMKQGVHLYDTDSEDEDIMNSLMESSSHTLTDQSEHIEPNNSVDYTESGKSFSFNSGKKTINNDSIQHSEQLKTNHKTKVSSNINEDESSDDNATQYKNVRFNPFDRDLHIDEDHFDEANKTLLRSQRGKLNSDSQASSLCIQDSSSNDDITFADLGLAEDHYSQPEGYFGMSSTEELEMAIETCKDMILMAPKDSDKQKNLVKKLVQLRLKLQDLKEGPEPLEDGVKMVVGHKFVIHSGSGSKHYCEKCNGVIWGLLQQWYKCSECGYCSHIKCLNQITRTCASVKVKEDPTYCLNICEEKGLSNQNYRCAECRASISYKSGYNEPRICDYSGNYYCELCHWNDNMLIPARVLHNWDFDEWKVCRASKQFLKLMGDKAVIRIQDINPMLFSFVEELNEVKRLREELLIMKKYILLCKLAMENKLLLRLQSRQHFVESSDNYSMKDLIDIQNDVLLPELAQVHSSWAQHIKTDCERCRVQGYVCEICQVDEVLFPFDNIAVVCADCSTVLHRHCFMKRDGTCPKCERRDKRKKN